MLRKCAVVSLLLVIAPVGISNKAMAQAVPPVLPDTTPARLLKGWIESLNAGDLNARTKFLTEHVSDAGRQMPPAQAAERDLRFRDRIGGGFDVVKIEESSATEVRALLKEKGGFGWGEILLQVDPSNPNLIISTELHPVPPPTETRPAREPQDALVRDLSQMLEKLAAEDRFSGAVLLAKNGEPVFEKAYGYADRDKKIANTMDTKFNIGSMNKMFTSVAIAQLVQQGKLSYSDTVAKLLPDYPDKDAAAKITVHQLLTHTSGLGDFFGPDFDQKKDSVRDLRDYLQFFAGKPLKFEPGKGWAYSNAGMIVAGLIVERASGQNYFDYVRDHIYKPAGMTSSGSHEKDKPEPNQAIGYMRQGDKWVSNYPTLPLMGSSAGGGYSTAPDLLRFAQALQEHKLLNTELTHVVTAGKVDTPVGGKYAYGFSESMMDGKRVIGHNGGAPGVNANLDIYWDSGYTVVVLANLDPPVAENINAFIRERIQP